MKRVFISLLVLILASSADAALQISIDGQDYQGEMHVVQQNVPLRMGIWTDSAIAFGNGDWAAWALITDYRYCTITEGESLHPLEPGIAIYDGISTIGLPEIIPGFDGVAGTITITGAPIPADSVIFDNINFRWVKSFTISVPVYLFGTQDFANFTLLDSAIVYLVPEPMTIGLLALGALFLRKKNKQRI